MAKTVKVGDKVGWSSLGGKSVGKVVKKVTTTARVKGHVAKATKGNPEYVVKSEKWGKTAIHRASALKKKSK